MLVAAMPCKTISRVFILNTLICLTISKTFLVETDDEDSPSSQEVEEDCFNKDTILAAHWKISNQLRLFVSKHDQESADFMLLASFTELYNNGIALIEGMPCSNVSEKHMRQLTDVVDNFKAGGFLIDVSFTITKFWPFM